YQDYTKRAKMSEVILAASACRTTITEVYQSGDTGPGANNWGCEPSSPPSKYVQSIATDENGVVTVTATGFNDNQIDNRVVTLVPYVNNNAPMTAANDMGKGVFKWVCGDTGTTIAAKYLPGSCKGV